jgi:hypothetical protein
MLQNVCHLPPPLPSPAMPPSKSSSNLPFEIQPETQALATKCHFAQSVQIRVCTWSFEKNKSTAAKLGLYGGIAF